MKSRPWVIKAGGELLATPATRERIVAHLAKWHKQKKSLVFVHGGGPQIEQELADRKIANRFVGGRRVTSPEAMVVIEQVLSGRINKGLASELIAKGAKAVGLSCRDGGLMTAQPLPGLERAAKPVKSDVALLKTLLKGRFLPVISSVATGTDGGAVNINADDAASWLAKQLKAERLVFLTNISGVLNDKKTRIPVLKTKTIDGLIDAGVITGGMIPKVQGARAAIKDGIGEVDIINGHMGVDFNTGTRIVK